MTFEPKFQITPALTKVLMDIEASRQAVQVMPVAVQALEDLHEMARLKGMPCSSRIKGDGLVHEYVVDALQDGGFSNSEGDEKVVSNYYKALEYVIGIANEGNKTFSEEQVQIIHGLVQFGCKEPIPYRDTHDIIRDNFSGNILYMPPEAKDVPDLMKEMVAWINAQIKKEDLPVPIIASIAHYQFATVHPYCDGNVRTVRLLTNLILYKSGYGLKGLYFLEEYYARNPKAYYDALTISGSLNSYNYYFGRVEADITKWIVYFCEGMASAFAKVRLEASEVEKESRKTNLKSSLRELDKRQKLALSLFIESRFVTTREIADLFKIHPRSALNLCKKWIGEGFLVQHGTSNKTRKYELADKWVALLG